MNSVPPLHPKPPGIALRALGLVVPGIRRVSAQIGPYTKWWSEQNQTALTATGPLLAVVGDSTAIGVGASTPELGYVGLVRDALGQRDGDRWRVINLAQSGARAADGLERQLPIVNRMADGAAGPTLTICMIGTNDVVWSSDTTVLWERLKALIGGLPAASLVGVVAGDSPRARVVNRAIRNAATENGLTAIDPWREPGPPPPQRLAEDRFHPSDLGYVLMARPFARHLEAPEPSTGSAAG
ncbi:MAG: SGNH/GDSL hydrolase family protein [Acidimicrobiales bacterium]